MTNLQYDECEQFFRRMVEPCETCRGTGVASVWFSKGFKQSHICTDCFGTNVKNYAHTLYHTPGAKERVRAACQAIATRKLKIAKEPGVLITEDEIRDQLRRKADRKRKKRKNRRK